jgi:hypothetical protein
MNKGLHDRSFGKHEDKALKQVFRMFVIADIQGESYPPEISDKDFVFLIKTTKTKKMEEFLNRHNSYVSESSSQYLIQCFSSIAFYQFTINAILVENKSVKGQFK